MILCWFRLICGFKQFTEAQASFFREIILLALFHIMLQENNSNHYIFHNTDLIGNKYTTYIIFFSLLCVIFFSSTFIYSFFKYIYWLCYYSSPISLPSLHFILPTHPLPHSPPIVHVHGVIHISSLASPFPILFLPSPCLFSTYHLSSLFCVSSPLSPLPLPCW